MICSRCNKKTEKAWEWHGMFFCSKECWSDYRAGDVNDV